MEVIILDKLLNTKEVANIVGVTENTVREWLRHGDLKAIKINKSWKISQTDLEAFIKNKGGN